MKATKGSTTPRQTITLEFKPVKIKIPTIDSSGNVGEFASVAIGLGDSIHILYYDKTNHALKYATWPIDIGLRIYDGTDTVAIACEVGDGPSPLKISADYDEDGTPENYGIVLVDTSHPQASKIRIKTPDGIKAWRKF